MQAREGEEASADGADSAHSDRGGVGTSGGGSGEGGGRGGGGDGGGDGGGSDGGGGGGGGGGSGADGGGGGADQRMPQAFEGIFARRVLGDEWFDPSELTHLLVP